MDRGLKRKLAAGTAAALAVAGGGAALAATQLSHRGESDAVVNDAAKRLGVQPSALRSALEQAFADRIDAAVAAGRITKAEGDELKARLRAGDLPFFGGPRHFDGPLGFHSFGPLDDAASYLGLTEAQLRSDLESGRTLAQIARSRGKTADGLVQALATAARKRLDAAVSAGRLTRAQEQSILADLRGRLTAFVNGKAGPLFDGRDGDGPPGFGGDFQDTAA